MGRGGKHKPPWKPEEASQPSWQLWRGSRSPQLRQDGRPWRSAATAPVFPTYNAMPQQPREHRASNVPPAISSFGRAKGLQPLLNAARKAEDKLRRLVTAKEVAAEQWVAFQQGLKDAFFKEQARYNRDGARLEKEIEDATREQHQSYRDIQQAFARGGVPEPSEDNVEAEETWRRMRTQWEQEDGSSMEQLIQRAVSAPASEVSAVARQLRPELQQLLAAMGALPFVRQGTAPTEGGDSTVPPDPSVFGPFPTGPPEFFTHAMPFSTGQGAVDSDASTACKGRAAMQVSPVHPGQRDPSSTRVPTAEEPPRPNIKAATMTPSGTAAAHSALADKLAAKRASAQATAMLPFQGKGQALAERPTTTPAPEGPAHISLEDAEEEDQEMTDLKDGPQSPGLGKMG